MNEIIEENVAVEEMVIVMETVEVEETMKQELATDTFTSANMVDSDDIDKTVVDDSEIKTKDDNTGLDEEVDLLTDLKEPQELEETLITKLKDEVIELNDEVPDKTEGVEVKVETAPTETSEKGTGDIEPEPKQDKLVHDREIVELDTEDVIAKDTVAIQEKPTMLLGENRLLTNIRREIFHTSAGQMSISIDPPSDGEVEGVKAEVDIVHEEPTKVS